MQLTAFKKIFSFKTSLDNEFILYLSKEKNNALTMIKNGYEPNYFQQKKLQSLLNQEAKKDINFLNTYFNNSDYIEDNVLITFLTSHALHDSYSTFKPQILSFGKRQNFGKELKNTIFNQFSSYTKFATSIKSYYGSDSQIKSFKFTPKEYKQYEDFRNLVWNTFFLLPVVINNLSDFIEFKEKIFDIRKQLLKHILKVSEKGALFEEKNKNAYNINLWNLWCEKLEKFDTSNLEQDLANRTKAFLNTNTIENNVSKELDITFEINKLLPSLALDENLTQLIENIIINYEHIKKESNNPIFVKELNNIYHDTLLSCQKYSSIHPNHRKDKTNIEGKNAEELLKESISHIGNIFNSYISNIEEYKISLLSVHNRKVKMK